MWKLKKNKVNIKKIIILLTFSTILIVSVITININLSKKNYKWLFDRNYYLKTAGYWELKPIEINDSDPTKNWAITASTYDWCSGSGTKESPYLLENIIINGQGSGSCIEIERSNAYFIIKNCTVFNAGITEDDTGIKLYYVNNGLLINNYCSRNINWITGGEYYNYTWSEIHFDNTRNGIYLDRSNNNTISENKANDLRNGILLANSYNNTISKNTINGNQYAGISLRVSDRNYIIGNTATNNNDGIHIGRSSDNNIILENIIVHNSYGIKLYYGDNNLISGNIANRNAYSVYLSESHINNIIRNYVNYNYYNGISLIGSDNNNIIENIINTSDYQGNEYYSYKYYGIYLEDSNANTIINNSILDNSRVAIKQKNCQNNIFENNEYKKLTNIPGYELNILLSICLFLLGYFILKISNKRKT